MKELKENQTKTSLSTKKLFTNDKSIKSKAEADRRMKEVNVLALAEVLPVIVDPLYCRSSLLPLL